jgi:DNA-binding CsgD family transcriptional regulator
MTDPIMISDADVGTMLRIVNAQADGDLGQPLPWLIFAGLKELVPCDAVSFFDLDSERQSGSFDQSIPVEEGNGDEAAFWLHYWDCLACSYPDRSGDLRSVTMASDFYTDIEWHDTGMYADYFRPIGLERELMVCLPGGPGRTVRLVFFRGPGSNFSERDRGILALLRPHLEHAYLDAELRRHRIPRLTPRQQQLMGLVANGYSNSQIARRLFISEGTVRKHLENIFERLDVTNRTAAVEQAFSQRLSPSS